MTWIYVGAGAAGLLVLAALGVRVLVAARGLNRQIAAAHEQFGQNGRRRDETVPRAAYDRG